MGMLPSRRLLEAPPSKVLAAQMEVLQSVPALKEDQLMIKPEMRIHPTMLEPIPSPLKMTTMMKRTLRMRPNPIPAMPCLAKIPTKSKTRKKTLELIPTRELMNPYLVLMINQNPRTRMTKILDPFLGQVKMELRPMTQTRSVRMTQRTLQHSMTIKRMTLRRVIVQVVQIQMIKLKSLHQRRLPRMEDKVQVLILLNRQ